MKFRTFVLFFLSILCGYTRANIVTITNKEQFDADILKAGKPAVVKFYADWCAPCKLSKEPFKTLSDSSEFSHIIFAEVNADVSPTLIENYDIAGLPTFMFVTDTGTVNAKKTGLLGAMDAESFEEMLKKMLHKTFSSPEQLKTTSETTSSETVKEEPGLWDRFVTWIKDWF